VLVEIRRLKRIAAAGTAEWSEQDDAALCAWIDDALGSDRVRIEVAALDRLIPRLVVRGGVSGLVLAYSARLLDRATGERLGWEARRMFLDLGIAAHSELQLERDKRGHGYARSLLQAAVASYDRWGVKQITLKAARDLGRWYWAHVGFDFADEATSARVRMHAHHVIQSLGIDVALSGEASAFEIAGLRTSSPVTLRKVAQVSERFDHKPVLDAARNGIEIDVPMALGMAIMLCGPPWYGALELFGADRARLDAYLDQGARQ
jgi:GNAT superfamily N-acetyltransferase